MALNLGCIKLGHRWNAIVVVSGKGYAAVLKKFVSLSALLKFPFPSRGHNLSPLLLVRQCRGALPDRKF